MFTISKRRCNQAGQVLLIVLKDGKEDRGGNAYVQQQVPEDFADYIIGLQEQLSQARVSGRKAQEALNEAIGPFGDRDEGDGSLGNGLGNRG